MSVSANVLNITRCSLHDGPGIRTVVFLKGCNLRCAWCHNPESHRMQNEVFLNPSRCIGCRRCSTLYPDCFQPELNREICTGCGKCAETCPSNAIEMAARPMTAEAVMKEVRKDRLYYESSGGGVTFSGGECLLFPEFLREMLQMCKAEGIHTAIESALCVPWKTIEPLIPLVDTCLIDIKHMDAAAHKTYTGQSNAQILDNILKLSQAHNNILIRVPLIPTVNDGPENLLETVRFCHRLAPAVTGLELLRYNTLSEPKYKSLDQSYQSFAAQPQTPEEMRTVIDTLNAAIETPGWVFFK